MIRLKFENTYYEETLEYSQTFTKTKEDRYYKVDVTGKSYKILIQQKNTIIALLTSLHHRVTLVENKLLTIEQNLHKST